MNALSAPAEIAAWRFLLSRYTWHWALTLTFRGRCGAGSGVVKRCRALLHMIEKDAYGRQWKSVRPAGLYWAFTLEPSSDGGIHIHVLLGFCVSPRREIRWRRIEAKWHIIGGHFRHQRVWAGTGAIEYITKSARWWRESAQLSDNLARVPPALA
jgi:hypothetical protein